jgi:hypothetical protein
MRHPALTESDVFRLRHSGAREKRANFDVQVHIRESITTIVSMDSGSGPSDHPGMTNRWIASSLTVAATTHYSRHPSLRAKRSNPEPFAGTDGIMTKAPSPPLECSRQSCACGERLDRVSDPSDSNGILHAFIYLQLKDVLASVRKLRGVTTIWLHLPGSEPNSPGR